jgi:hypothetical protein
MTKPFELNETVFVRRIMNTARGSADCVLQGLIVGINDSRHLSLGDGGTYVKRTYEIHVSGYGEITGISDEEMHKSPNDAFGFSV